MKQTYFGPYVDKSGYRGLYKKDYHKSINQCDINLRGINFCCTNICGFCPKCFQGMQSPKLSVAKNVQSILKTIPRNILQHVFLGKTSDTKQS